MKAPRVPEAPRNGSLAKLYRASVASPPWFALPVEVEERPDSLTIAFDVPERTHGGVCVKARSKSLLVVGHNAAVRACSLPQDAITSHLETERSGDLLRVRIPLRGPKPASQPSPPLKVVAE